MDKTPDKIDYIIHESILARQERQMKRLWVLCLIIFIALIGTNAGWLWYESQWQDEVVTQEVTQDGGFNSFSGRMIGGDYGETED